VLSGGCGHIPPDSLDGLPALGEVDQVMRDVLAFRMRAMRRSTDTPTLDQADRVRDTMAREIGISVDALTRCINSEAIPDMAATSWGKLVKAYYFTRGDHENSQAP
jgi:hypothetical protein